MGLVAVRIQVDGAECEVGGLGSGVDVGDHFDFLCAVMAKVLRGFAGSGDESRREGGVQRLRSFKMALVMQILYSQFLCAIAQYLFLYS